MSWFSSELPLKFEFTYKPTVPQECTGIMNCGDPFDLFLKITTIKSPSFSHRGIEFEFCTEIIPEDGHTVKISSTSLILCQAGAIPGSVDFNLPQCVIPENAQTYVGKAFSVKTFVRASVKKTFGNIDYQEEIIAYNIQPFVAQLEPLCVRVAVAESIRMDLMINRRKFEIGDVIIGAAHFLLVQLRVKVFKVAIVAQEYLEMNGLTSRNRNIIEYWELTDGPPVKNEIIPFRLFLAPVKLTPSCSFPEKGYSVTHFLHFTIATMSGEKYFKALQIKVMKMNRLPFNFVGEDTLPIVKKQPESNNELDE